VRPGELERITIGPEAWKRLSGKRVAVLGYGSQGHAHALNLRDSGADVVIGGRADSASLKRAAEDQFRVSQIAEAVRGADLVIFALPDDRQKQVFEAAVASELAPRACVGFIHGFSVHFGGLRVPSGHGVVMVAPKGAGHFVRSEFLLGRGVPCLLAVHQDPSGDAETVARAWCMGIGGPRAGVFRTTFGEECESDLFGEQAVLCGGMIELMRAGFQTLVEAGFSPELAWFECVQEVRLILDLVLERGLDGMRSSISSTARYGGSTRGPRMVTDEVRREMARILGEIRDGRFAAEFARSGAGPSGPTAPAPWDAIMERARRRIRNEIA
jgi:ketol-acid reductoisomerase